MDCAPITTEHQHTANMPSLNSLASLNEHKSLISRLQITAVINSILVD